MGEMADLTVENGMDSDLLDDGEQAATSCRYCGKDGLYWYQDDHGWRLILPLDDGSFEIHRCDQYRSHRR